MIQFLKCLIGIHEWRGWNPTFSSDAPKYLLASMRQRNECTHCNEIKYRNASHNE